MTIIDTSADATSSAQASDRKVLVCLNHGADQPENVLVAYLAGVEALRAGKQVVMFLTRDGVHVATQGFASTIQVPDAPSVEALHDEYVATGGRFFACPVCVRTRGLQDAAWAPNTEVKGFPSVYEYTAGGALVFNY
ncbi:MAG TPA: DsrE family protein [Acidimicrobiales bacterium]